MNLLQKSIPVLMYHQLNQSNPSTSLIVSRESFRQQMDWLERKRFRFLSLDEVVDRQDKASLWDRVIALSFDDGFRDNYENGFSVLIQRYKPAALFVVVDWVGREGFLGWREIRELAIAGITIGSHSLSHRWLPDITDDGELEREITESKKRIEDEVGKEVVHFSYPVGGVDERVAACVKKAGYRAAWVAGASPTRRIKDPLLCLRRIKVTPSDSHSWHFAVKAYGARGMFR
jgi:peptidoglycan/xylan/chitin deacetylase (PgdA/CDA1 family)